MVEAYYTNRNGVNYSLPSIKITYSSNLNTSPSKIVIDVLKSDFDFEMSCGITLVIDYKTVFTGYIFNIQYSESIVTLTAYDQIRYLLYKDTMSFKAYNASSLVGIICSSRNLYLKFFDDSSFVLPSKVYRNISYLDMINDSIYSTYYSTGENFCFFDIAGDLYFKNANNLVISTSLHSSHNILSYKFIKDINSNTYNYFKIEKEHNTKKINFTFVEQDIDSQNKHGTLQYYKKVDFSTPDANIYNSLSILKQKYSKILNSIKIRCIGNNEFTVGSIVYVNIDEQKISDFFIIKNCVHTFENGYYICDLILHNV